MNRLRKTTVLCVCSFLTVYMLFQHVFYLGYVPSTSMEPTIRQGSYILGTRLVSSLRRGDIIVFSHEHQTLTKRIASQMIPTMCWATTVQPRWTPGSGKNHLYPAAPSLPNTFFEA